MDWLNYHHLYYFWVVAREGSVVRASAQLRLAQSTISGQIHSLEKALGEQLFTQVGRHLQLTDVGQVVYRYADEIFTLGRDLLGTLRGQPTAHPLRVVVGITDVLPKRLVYRLLQPALHQTTPVRLVCHEWEFAHLLAELALRRVDVVLADMPLSPGITVRASLNFSQFVEDQNGPGIGQTLPSSLCLQWSDLRPPVRSVRPAQTPPVDDSCAGIGRNPDSLADSFC